MVANVVGLLTLCTLLGLVGCNAERSEEKQIPAKKEPAQPEQVPGKASEAASPQATGTRPPPGGTLKLALMPENPVAGDCFRVEIAGAGKKPSFTWMVNEEPRQSGALGRFCPQGVKRGDVVSVLSASGDSEKASSVTIANSPPRIVDSKIELVSEESGASLVITPQVEDADGDAVKLVYRWFVNQVENLDFRDHRLPSSAYRPGDSVQVEIVSDDGIAKGPRYSPPPFDVPSISPVIVSKPPLSFVAEEYVYQVQAKDPDSSTVAFSLGKGPAGMTINRQTGLVSWSLKGVAPGQYPVKIVVQDMEGGKDSQEFTLDLSGQ